MKYHKLRIAFSVTCGIACVLLVVLSVSSYRWRDEVNGAILSHQVMATSLEGRLRLAVARDAYWPGTAFYYSRLSKDDSSAWTQHQSSTLGLQVGVSKKWVTVGMPHWFLILVTGAFVTALWVKRPWHFSVRTALIATTVLGVVLGLAVYVAGK